MIDKIAELEKWKKVVEELDTEVNKLIDVLHVDPESPLLSAIWKMQDAYTHAVADKLELGDWLSWYHFDNDMGKKAYDAGTKEEMRKIKSFEDLIWAASLS